MPHLTLDYSPNLATADEMTRLCRDLSACLIAQRADGKQVYPTGGVRVRAFAADACCIADASLDAAYLHAALKVGAGRSDATLRSTGDAVFEVIKRHFADRFERSALALSLEIGEFSEAGTWKHNNLHARLKKV
jgi:5-carboxymethyl-2-hydroxymuconate isomerase